MNKGSSGFNSIIKVSLSETVSLHAQLKRQLFSPLTCLASTLWLTTVLGGALPVIAQSQPSSVAQAGTESTNEAADDASDLNDLLEGISSPETPGSPENSAPPETSDSLESVESPTPSDDSSIPSLPPLAAPADPVPTQSLPADQTPPQQPVPSFEAAPTTGTQNQVPSLPPQTAPRYEDPLIVPNTVVTPNVLQPAFDDYHLGPGDSIFVSVQRYPDLSFQATLDLQGNIIVPLQGAVPFEGLTLAEAEDRLRLVFNQYVVIREARDVSLTLVAQRGVEVTVLGSVQRPGFYPLPDPTVATALLTAGGATRTSDLRAIQVQRQLRRNGQLVEETVNVDLFTPLKEGSPLPDVRLEDGDVVIIPELDPSQLDEYDRYLVARSTLAQPVINVRFLNYSGGRSRIGTLNLNNGSTFLDGISLLGVSPDTANLGDVALIRYDPETGRAVTVSLDAKSAIEGDITQNPPLEDSDVIVVGRNLIGRLSFALQTVTRPFRDVLGFTRFFDDVLDDIDF